MPWFNMPSGEQAANEPYLDKALPNRVDGPVCVAGSTFDGLGPSTVSAGVQQLVDSALSVRTSPSLVCKRRR